MLYLYFSAKNENRNQNSFSMDTDVGFACTTGKQVYLTLSYSIHYNKSRLDHTTNLIAKVDMTELCSSYFSAKLEDPEEDAAESGELESSYLTSTILNLALLSSEARSCICTVIKKLHSNFWYIIKTLTVENVQFRH